MPGTWSLLSCASLTHLTERHPPPAERVVYITRELCSSDHYAYIHTSQHTEEVTDAALLSFFGRHSDLSGRIPESDLRFLSRLARCSRTRTLLTAEEPLDPALAQRLTTTVTVFSDTDRSLKRTENLAQLDFLNPVDHIKVLLLLEALESPALLDRLADTLRRDLVDRNAEYGGFILLTSVPDAPIEFVPVPSQVQDDLQYSPPEGLYSFGDFALWHAHVHNENGTDLREIDNSSRAGPSGVFGGSLLGMHGDIWLCYLQTVDGVVITPTGGNTLNLDFVSSEGAVLDLGSYTWHTLPTADGIPDEPGEKGQ